MSNAPIRVFIATGNRLLGEALFRLFENEKDVKVVGQSGHCSEITEQIAKARPDVFLLNPASPLLLDFVYLQGTHRRFPQLKIVLFGMAEDENVFTEAVRQGAVGYILQDASTPAVVAAVRSVVRGEAVCPPRLCLSLFMQIARQRMALMPAHRMHASLKVTRREQELVPMIALRLTNKEIAALLHISEQTVKNQIHRLIQKLGANKRQDVVELCGLPKYIQ